MNAPASKPAASLILPAIGAPFEGGFYAGQFQIGAQTYALIRAPNAEGRHKDTVWNSDDTRVEGALSYCDGMANTEAMAAAGSKIALWARARVIGGFNDWHIPSQDELELLYRAFKPTGEDNTLWGRSGLNASAVPPTQPYSVHLPAQVDATAFRPGGVEAMDDVWHWSSTQHAGVGAYAWCQHFAYGYQDGSPKGYKLRVVLVRRVAI